MAIEANALDTQFTPSRAPSLDGGVPDGNDGRKAKWHSIAMRLLRDPFFLFLIVGSAIFLAYYITQQSRSNPITYGPDIEKQLVENFETISGRKAGPADKEKLREEYIGDELMFREALERGLHLSDSETRERLIDQLRYMVVGAPVEPTEEQLVDYYASHPDLYRTEPGISFTQIFFANAPTEAGAADILARLNRNENVKGDDFWLGRDFPNYGQSMIRGIFGQPFLTQLSDNPMERWYGPVRSSRGWHFVRKSGTKPSAPIPYATARPQVRQDFMVNSTGDALNQEIEKLKEKYDVEITG